MKRIYEDLELEIIRFESEDVITGSTFDVDPINVTDPANPEGT